MKDPKNRHYINPFFVRFVCLNIALTSPFPYNSTAVADLEQSRHASQQLLQDEGLCQSENNV